MKSVLYVLLNFDTIWIHEEHCLVLAWQFLANKVMCLPAHAEKSTSFQFNHLTTIGTNGLAEKLVGAMQIHQFLWQMLPFPLYHKVTGSNPADVLNFFRLLMQLHKLRSQLRGSFFIWFHFRSFYIWFIRYTFITFISFTGTFWTHNWPGPNISGFMA